MDTSEPTSPAPKRRGRKRQSEEDNISEEDRRKKEKNREAARKCREKKEKEAKELKERNSELEKENKNLADEKRQLESKVKSYVDIISNHLDRGCKLPPQVQELWQQEQAAIASGGDAEMENFRAVGTIETPKAPTPPRTPEYSPPVSPLPRRKQSVTPASPISNNSQPTALFSGTPLPAETLLRKRSSSSTSSTVSSSPSPPPQPFRQSGNPRELTDYLQSNSIPQALAPIGTVSDRREVRPSNRAAAHEQSSRQNASSVNTASAAVPQAGQNHWTGRPIVIIQGEPFYIQDASEDGKVISVTPISGPSQKVPSAGTYNNIPSNEVLEKAFQQPDISSEDEVSKSMYMSQTNGQMQDGTYTTAQDGQDNQNLSSLGFSCMETVGPPENYSFTEDLHRVEPADKIMQSVHGNSTEETGTAEPGADDPRDQDISLLASGASAVLEMWPQMAPALQQQIKTSLPASSTMNDVTQTASQDAVIRTQQLSHSHVKQQRQAAVQQWVNEGQQHNMVGNQLSRFVSQATEQVYDDPCSDQTVPSQNISHRHTNMATTQPVSRSQTTLPQSVQYHMVQAVNAQASQNASQVTRPNSSELPNPQDTVFTQQVSKTLLNNGYSALLNGMVTSASPSVATAAATRGLKDTLSYSSMQMQTQPQLTTTVPASGVNGSVTFVTVPRGSSVASQPSHHVVSTSNTTICSAVSSQGSLQSSSNSTSVPMSSQGFTGTSALGSMDLGLPSLTFNEMSEPTIFDKKPSRKVS